MSQLTDDELLRQMQKDNAYADGYEAYRIHGNRDANPFNNDDEWDLNQAWLDGFMDAVWDD